VRQTIVKAKTCASRNWKGNVRRELGVASPFRITREFLFR
jgi:hypothetical protein